MSKKVRILLAHNESGKAASAVAALVPLLNRDLEVVRATSAKEIARLGETVDLAVAVHERDRWSPVECLRSVVGKVKVVVLTPEPSIDEAVRLLKDGFTHYANLVGCVETLASFIHQQVAEVRARPVEIGPASSIPTPIMIGPSRALAKIRELVESIAKSPASTVLITGESGTGKDVTARMIHALSDRRRGPFLNITCSAIPETLLESELFGHERGAFTDARVRKLGLVEQADGGTLFLDEIGEMSPGLQAKLLRLLEEKSFRRVGGSVDIKPNIRIVAATNRDLHASVLEGRFRADLFYRLAVLQIHVPTLRDRPEDIAPLALHFVEQFGVRFGRTEQSIAPAALVALTSHSWPGNIRELRNTLERAVLLCDDETVKVENILLGPTGKSPEPFGAFKLPEGGLVLSQLEDNLVTQALVVTSGNITGAAKLLGMSRDQLRYRVNAMAAAVAAPDVDVPVARG